MNGQLGRWIMENKNKLKFHEIPIASNNVKSIGSLIFDERSILGEKAYLDLRNVQSHPKLARDFISCLSQIITPNRITSALSIFSYATAIRVFINFCEINELDSDFNLSKLTNSILKEFKHYLKITYSNMKSGNLRRKYGNISRLIEGGKLINLTPEDLILPSNFKEENDSDTTEPYTTTEALDLEFVCRNQINHTLDFLEDGKRLLKLGSDPQVKCDRNRDTGRFEKSVDKGWSYLPNLLWYVVHKFDGKCLTGKELREKKYWSFINAVNSTERFPHTKRDIYRRLYPLAIDLIPFLILISKKTGLNETSILTLERDCLEERDGQYYLTFEKRRGSNPGKFIQIYDKEEYSAVYLIKILEEITSPLVRHADLSNQNLLFLGLTIATRCINPVKPIDPSYIKYQMNNASGWCVQNGLTDENNLQLTISLRSLRVTNLCEGYKIGGSLANVSKKASHKSSDTTKLYTNNEAMRETHELAAERGIKQLLNSTKPQIIIEDSIKDKDINFSKILNGDQDVFFSACSDIYNRPGGKANTKCEKPWECFTCSNAIFTQHTLPRVLAFKDFMLKEKQELSTLEWNEKFEKISKIIDEDIISKFDPISLAKAEIASKSTSLYIPIVFKIR